MQRTRTGTICALPAKSTWNVAFDQMDKHMLVQEIERLESILLPVQIMAILQQSSERSGLVYGRGGSEAESARNKVEARGKAVIVVSYSRHSGCF